MDNLYSLLKPAEAAFHDALISITEQYGPLDKNSSGIWIGYETGEQNQDSGIGVKCSNCAFYDAESMGCHILSYKVEPEGNCRLAAIPDQMVQVPDESMGKQAPCWEGYVQRGMKDKGGKMVPNCVPVATKAYEGCDCEECLSEDISCTECDACTPDMNKADDSYAPTSGMKSAARRALKWKEDGKATGAGTPVGWGRASDIVAGRSMSLSTVMRMYSFFARHEVDKKGKDFYNTSNPSNGRIMWDAWGGDAGFTWSRGIAERAKANKAWEGSSFSFTK